MLSLDLRTYLLFGFFFSELGDLGALFLFFSSQPEGQGASEPERGKTDLPQVREVMVEASRDVGSAPKEAHGVIDITKLPSFTESMYNKAHTVKECPIEGAHRAYDPFRGFFDGVDSTAIEDVTRLGDLEVPKKSPYLGTSRPSSSQKLINRFQDPSVDPD